MQNLEFVPIPRARLKDRIAQLDEEYSIFFIKIQKSYTSIASFLDGAIYLLMARNPTRFGKGSPIVISDLTGGELPRAN